MSGDIETKDSVGELTRGRDRALRADGDLVNVKSEICP
jgi:hypothetical protein